MEFNHVVAAASLLISICYAQTCCGDVLFSALPQTLQVSASPTQHQVLKVGEDSISITWGLNQSLPEETGASYTKVELRLCYAPASQADRKWRNTVDNLSKDRTCRFTISHTRYYRTAQNLTWTIEEDVPTAVYFVRAYAYDSSGNEVAYGQTTDANKTTNLFKVQAISGHHLSLDIASACFSAFALLSPVGFFLVEKRGRTVENT